MGTSTSQVWPAWRGVDDEGLGRITGISADACVEQTMTKVQETPLDELLSCKALWSLGASSHHPLREISGEILVNPCKPGFLVRNKETTLVNTSREGIYGKNTREFSESIGSEKGLKCLQPKPQHRKCLVRCR